jgi:hypothetical protein
MMLPATTNSCLKYIHTNFSINVGTGTWYIEQLNDLYPQASAGNTRPITASDSSVAVILGRLDMYRTRYFCTIRWYLWRARLRSDAKRVREPDRRVSPQRWLDTERSTSYSRTWSYSWTHVHKKMKIQVVFSKGYPVGISVLIWECTGWDQQCMRSFVTGSRSPPKLHTPKTYEIT